MKKEYGFLLGLTVVLILGIFSINEGYAQQCKIRTDTKFVDGCSGPWIPNLHTGPINIDAKELFNSACNRHDQCYHSCRCSKDYCDNLFRDDMNATCDNRYPPNIIKIGFWETDANSAIRGVCYAAKDAFYAAVQGGGGSSYNEGQRVCNQ